jgi:hypothetical protein
MKTHFFQLIIGLACLMMACQKDQEPIIPQLKNPGYAVIEYQEEFAGTKSGIAPLLNLNLLVMDSTLVLTDPTQVLFNGALIDSIIAPLSGGIGAIYLNTMYNHYSSLRIKYKDGTEYYHPKPIYITFGSYSNINIKGPLTSWSSLGTTFKYKEQRYRRLNVWKPSRLPLRGENWRIYTYEVKDSTTTRIDLLPRSKEYRLYRFF